MKLNGLDIEQNRKKYDSKFKSTIKKTDVLAAFLHEYIDEYMEMDRDQILACIDKEATGRYAKDCNPKPLIGKKNDSEMDTLFRVRLPDSDQSIAVYVNIEGQNKFYLPYPIEKRAESYVSELILSQNGKEILNHDYKNLKKVYSVWLIFNPPNRLKNTVIRYDRRPEVMFGDLDVKVPDMDLTHVIMVYIGDYNEALPDPLALVSALFSDNMDSDTRFNTLDDRFNITFTDEERKEVEDLVSLHDSFYEGYVNYGMTKGYENATSKDVASLSAKLDMSVEQAMDLLDVPQDIREDVRTGAERILHKGA